MVVISAEPPADEPLEGQRLDPELLSRVKDILISDAPPAFGNSGGAFPAARSSDQPSNSYGAPSGPPSAPVPQNGGYHQNGGPAPHVGDFSGQNSFGGAAPRVGGGFGGKGRNSFGGAPSGVSGDITLSDPELAPLLANFDLSPTVEKRTNSAPGLAQSGSPFGAAPSFNGAGAHSGSGGY